MTLHPKAALLIIFIYQRISMAESELLEPSSPAVSRLEIKLPPVNWIHFNMDQSQHLAEHGVPDRWGYTWMAILLASGIPHDGSRTPARFLLSEHDDHALAVLVRTTINLNQVGTGDLGIISEVSGKPIFSWLSRYWLTFASIEIVYPSQLSKEEAGRFTIHGEPLKVIEHGVEAETNEGSIELGNSSRSGCASRSSQAGGNECGPSSVLDRPELSKQLSGETAQIQKSAGNIIVNLHIESQQTPRREDGK